MIVKFDDNDRAKKTEDYNKVQEELKKVANKSRDGRVYELGQFGVIDKDGLSVNYNRIWYSFDKDTYNFHIVPAANATIVKKIKDVNNLSEWLRNVLDGIVCTIRQSKEISNFTSKTNGPRKEGSFSFRGKKYDWWRSEGNKDWTINHKWISIKDKESEYLLLPCRLWHEGNCVNNSFGKIQFMRYPYKPDKNGVNKIDINNIYGKFQMIYPPTDVAGAYVHVSDHCVYNPKDSTIESEPNDLTIESEPKVIAEEFVKFIKGEIV